MGIIGFTKIVALLCFVLLHWTLPSIEAQAEIHSLYYIYTALSKPVDLPGIYEFTAMGLLDDRQIDYYNSKEKRKIPTQHWMKENLQEDYWEKGSQSRNSKEQWFNVNINIMMDRMRHNNTDLHVLQERVGCEVFQQEGHFHKGIYEISYDGENFLSFDGKESQWVAPVATALPTKRKWNNVTTLNEYFKGYLEKDCVDWLSEFREYRDQEFRNVSLPDVHVFAKRSISDESKLNLTCLITGFYHKDMMMTIRTYRMSLKEEEMISTGIRPNHDGSFQMRKSVEIKKEKAKYDCYVFHSTLKESIITKWDGKCWDCPPEPVSDLIGAVIGGLLVLAVVALVVFLTRKGINVFRRRNIEQHEDNNPDEVARSEGRYSASGFSGSSWELNKDSERDAAREKRHQYDWLSGGY